MTTPDTPTLADTIRRLDGEGTPGPWTAHLRERFLAEDATGATVYEVWSHMPYEKFDNDLIVTLRNHAAEIADALEAVERVRDYLALDMHDGECHSLRPHFAAIGPEVCNCTHGNVRRALGGE